MNQIKLSLTFVFLVFISCGEGPVKNICQEDLSNRRLIESKYLGKIQPKNSSEIPSSCWGIQAGSLQEDIVSRAADIGVKWTRLQADWPSVEKIKGEYDFDQTDKAFEIAINNGITPFVTIGKGNPLYSDYGQSDDPALASIYGKHVLPPVHSEVNMQAFLAYVSEVVERYKDKIKYWEIWNEPNHFNYWGGNPEAEEYGRLVQRTASLIRSIDPDCHIIAGATAGIDPEFTDKFLSQVSKGLIDIITFHNYGPIPEERAYAAEELWKVIDRHDPDIVLWQGECGYPSAGSTKDFRGRSPWGNFIQAKWLLRQSFTDVFFCNAELSNYFLLANFGDRDSINPRTNLRPIDSLFGFPERSGSRVRTWGVNEKCLLSNPDLSPKPGYFAYQNLCAVWDNTYKPARTSYKFDIIDQGIFYGIKWDDAFPSVPLLASFKNSEGENLIAWWLPWTMSEFLPEFAKIDITVTGMSFNEPVLIDLIEGTVFRIKDIERTEAGIVLRNLPLADFPFLICEKAKVSIIR